MRTSKWDAEPTKLKCFTEEDGSLYPIEFTDLPFTPKRIFYVSGVPEGEERGKHAHYHTEQILICTQGQIIVKLSNGYRGTEHTLNPGEAIHVHKMVWDSQVFVTGSDVLVALCSTNYDRSDYIEDWKKFQHILAERRKTTCPEPR